MIFNSFYIDSSDSIGNSSSHICFSVVRGVIPELKSIRYSGVTKLDASKILWSNRVPIVSRTRMSNASCFIEVSS